MASESETVAEVAAAMRRLDTVFNLLYWGEYANRIEAAHKREVAELRRQREEAFTIVNVVEKCASIERQTEAMLKKNGVIAGLRKEVAELRECLKEAMANKLGTCRSRWPCALCSKNCEVKRWRKALEGAGRT